MGGSGKWLKEYGNHEYDVWDFFLKDDINYKQTHFSLVHTQPNIINLIALKPHANDPISDSRYTGHYPDTLSTIVNNMDSSESPIKMKLPNSSTMSSTNQAKLHFKIYHDRQNLQKY